MANLSLRVREVKCVDETGGNRFTEIGKDDIYLAAVTLDSQYRVRKIPPFKVGGFDDGDKKTYSPPKAVASFDLPNDRFPHNVLVNLVLIEKDSGNQIDPFLDKLAAKTKAAADDARAKAKAKADAVGGTAKADDGDSGIWKAVVEVLVVVGKEIFKEIRKDDIFPPVPIRGTFTSPKVDGREYVATFKGHDGHYRVTYDWFIS